MATKLTDEQRATLDAAEQILTDLLVKEEVIMTSLHAGWEGMSVTYFSPSHVQHGSIWVSGLKRRPTLADKIDRALEIRADEEGRADEIKAKRVAELQAQLAALTAEQAA